MLKRFAILGAAGDLTSRLLLPALADLLDEGKLPGGFEIVGMGLEPLTTASFRAHISEALAEFAAKIPEDVRDRLVQTLSYSQGDVTDAGALKTVLKPEQGPLVVYLALPPPVFESSVRALAEAGVGQDSRLVIEKPHSVDYASVQKLNALLAETYTENSIFRMDHFLGKQTVQNVLGLRFANRLFEPLWTGQHIERVDIRWDETLTLEGRASYYDRAGALRDMLQNHLLQILCMIAMEPPASLNERDLRDQKVAVLRAVRNLSPGDVARQTVRARYAAGRVGEREVPAYAQESGVKPERETETFAQVKLFVDTWRWGGVPFVLRSGKALGETCQEAVVTFREVPALPLWRDGHPRRNALRLRFRPDELSLDLNLNGAGDPFELEPAELDLVLAPQEMTAYARLLLDILEGDNTLSIRADEAEEAWRIVTPILEAWKGGSVPMQEYPAGSDLEPSA
jgi:glucose-6-phosphate 1-dehydrogenase